MSDKIFNLRGYVILSNLLKSSDELLASADHAKQTIVNNPEGNIEPRLREIETITELLRPLYEQSGHNYQYAVQQVRLSELRSLIEANSILGDHSSFTYTPNHIQKLANEISFSSIVTSKYETEQLSWRQDVEINTCLGLIREQQSGLSELKHIMSFDDMISALTNAGHTVIRTSIDNIRLKDSTLTINGEHTLKFKGTSIEGRFIGLFFNGIETLKKRGFQLGDIIERLDSEDFPNPNKDQVRSLQKRYSQVKETINMKIKAKAGIDEFICYEDKEFFVNPRLLK